MSFGNLNYDNFNNTDYIPEVYSAPTLAQTQKWLRKKKNVLICP